MLTERIVRDAKPDSKAHILWDETVRGLGVKLYPSGLKAYVLSYRVAGRKRLATIARTSEISLRAARDRAGTELAVIRSGDTDPLERQRNAREAPTVNDGLDRFFSEHVPARLQAGRMAPRTVKEYRWQANKTIRPAIGRRKIVDVTRRDVERMVARMLPVARNRTLALTSRLFRQFEHWELRPQYTNPARGIERSREEPRDRVLSPTELAALGDALERAESTKPAPVAAIRFAALTGLRIGEVLAIQWKHVDSEYRTVVLPRTKTGRRVHGLPTAALELLTRLPRINGYVFTTGHRAGRDAPVGYQHLRTTFSAISRDAGLLDVRLHDLRRTVMTSAARSGLGTHALRDLLGHKTATMADRYIRQIGAPVREAQESIGAAIAAQLQGAEPRRVVSIHRKETA